MKVRSWTGKIIVEPSVIGVYPRGDDHPHPPLIDSMGNVMRSKNNAPTAVQKRWMEAVRELGSVISGNPAVIHHAVGRSAKIKGVGNIGHWWIIPLTDDEHKALHNGETFGDRTRKEFEKSAFQQVVSLLDSDDLRLHVFEAIMDYHR